MKWALPAWPVGPWLIPTGTVVEGVAGAAGEIAEAPKWNGMALPLPLPINATPLDEEAALMMLRWYGEGELYRLGLRRARAFGTPG